jgi:hypothetical protein
MARFNEILVGRYNRFMQKLLSMKGDASLFQFSSEMGGYLPFFSGAENRYLEGWNRFGWSFQNGPTAAQTNGMRLRNPLGSNIVAVIEKITMISTNNVISLLVSLGDDNPDLETIAAIAPCPLDSRQGSLATHTSNLIASTGALSPPAQRVIYQGFGGQTGGQLNDVINDENQEITVLPRRSITLQQVGANSILIGSIFWRERLLEESERA